MQAAQLQHTTGIATDRAVINLHAHVHVRVYAHEHVLPLRIPLDRIMEEGAWFEVKVWPVCAHG